MDDIDIIKQLLNGNHLEPNELERAVKLVYLLDREVKERCRKWMIKHIVKVAKQHMIKTDGYLITVLSVKVID